MKKDWFLICHLHWTIFPHFLSFFWLSWEFSASFFWFFCFWNKVLWVKIFLFCLKEHLRLKTFRVFSVGDGVSYPIRCMEDEEDTESLLGADSRQEFEIFSRTDHLIAADDIHWASNFLPPRSFSRFNSSSNKKKIQISTPTLRFSRDLIFRSE